MNYPKSILDVCTAAAEQHENIDAAVDYAVPLILELQETPSLYRVFVRDATRSLIQEARHRANVKMRLEAGEYGNPAKVVVGRCEEVEAAAKNYYDYAINGTFLGEVLGEELMGIANNELAKADGFIFNAKLCQKLRSLVPDGKTVKEAVALPKLRKVIQSVQNAMNKELLPA